MGRAIGAMEREGGCATKDKRLMLAIIRKLLLAWEKCIAWRRKRRRNSLRERCSAEVVGWSGRRVGGEGMSLAGMGEGMRSRFQGKATRRLLTVERRRGAWGEDQSTGDDFITTRHSSTTLKYQKSGGLIQVRQSARRGAARPRSPCASFLHNAFLVSPKEKGEAVGCRLEGAGQQERREKLACTESNPRRPDSPRPPQLSPSASSFPSPRREEYY